MHIPTNKYILLTSEGAEGFDSLKEAYAGYIKYLNSPRSKEWGDSSGFATVVKVMDIDVVEKFN